MAESLGLVRGAAVPTATVEVTGPDAAPTVPSSVPFSLGPPLSRPSIPPSADVGVTDQSLSSATTPAPAALFAASMMSSHLIDQSTAVSSTAVVLVSATPGGDLFSGPVLAAVIRSSATVLPASPAQSHSRWAGVFPGRSLPVPLMVVCRTPLASRSSYLSPNVNLTLHVGNLLPLLPSC